MRIKSSNIEIIYKWLLNQDVYYGGNFIRHNQSIHTITIIDSILYQILVEDYM